MPLISVIIPLYNKEKYIKRALDSVFLQTFLDYEVIVVDDGSTDKGPDQVEAYEHPKLRLIRQDNSGPGSARNKGVWNACGKYVSFLDADDEWMPQFLEFSITNLLENPECVLSTCNYFQESSRQTTKLTELAGMKNGKYRLPVHIDVRKLSYITGIIHSAGTVLCLTEIFKTYGGFYEKKSTWGEDRFLWIQILLNHEIFYDERKMFWYHTESSELAPFNINRKFSPMVIDPELIRNRCKVEYKNLANRYLATWALHEAHSLFSIKRKNEIIKILKMHPLCSTISPYSYLKLRIKLMFPFITDIFRNRYY